MNITFRVRERDREKLRTRRETLVNITAKEKTFTATITTLRETRPGPTTKDSNTKARLMGSRR